MCVISLLLNVCQKLTLACVVFVVLTCQLLIKLISSYLFLLTSACFHINLRRRSICKHLDILCTRTKCYLVQMVLCYFVIMYLCIINRHRRFILWNELCSLLKIQQWNVEEKKPLFFYFNLSLDVMLANLSCSFTSISFLANLYTLNLLSFKDVK